MIAREKDSVFGWKFEDFEFRAALTVRKNKPRPSKISAAMSELLYLKKIKWPFSCLKLGLKFGRTGASALQLLVSLHFIDFLSCGVMDNGPLYCITL
jgi:hypothetical protein